VDFNDIKAPYEDMVFEENKSIVYAFCTLCSLLENKKLNFQHVFAMVLTNEKYKNFLKLMLNEESDLEMYKILLEIEPSIASSKYISKISKNLSI
jgi:hypothetical protein